MLRNILLASCLLSAVTATAQEDKSINSDGTKFEAPRLAGDSLAIKPLDKESSSSVSSIEDMFAKGKVKGLIRYSGQYRDTDYHATQSSSNARSSKTQQYTAIGGYLGYETAAWNNFSMGATFYVAEKLGNNPDERIGLGGLKEEDTDGDGKADRASSYAVLGEAYLKYKDDENDFRYGRREMPSYRFVSLSNIRFTPLTHQGATYENTMFEDTKLIAGYISKQKNRNADEFVGMVRAARVNTDNIAGDYDPNDFDGYGNYNAESKSMSMLAINHNKETYNIELWDYYVEDFVNTVYLYGDKSFKLDKDTTLTFAAQYAQQNNIGDNVAGDVNTWFYGLKTQVSFDSGITTFLSWNEVKYDERTYAGGTIFVRWGTPQMFNSFQVQDSETAGTKSLGCGIQFELGKMGLVPNTVIRFRYADYNMPDNISQEFAAQDRTETTFDLRYSFTKNDGFGIFTEMEGLSVQFRVAYDDYKTDYNYAKYMNRFPNTSHIHEVTDDFVDVRLYVDYMF
jgi:hypothetical protein